ncbi:ATP-binding protein [Poseidonocella sp. HB161398]|uniref:ATP-binding protein n=1 Tax=Poseidonocella sp. HB161398 TaxID=2320855 RepID=UPI001107FB4A|nr:ATP-binding protein [Poseidonocella sp. HB161398]
MTELLKSNRAWAICVAVIAALAVAIGFVIYQMQPRDSALQEFRARLAALDDREASWSLDLLAVELGIAPNYDAVARGVVELEAGLDALQGIQQSDGSLAALGPELARFAETVERKIWYSEQIKASYAMMRNSASVLPSGVSAFFENPQVYSQATGDGERLADMMSQTVMAMTSFVISPTDSLAATVAAEFDEMRQAVRDRSPGLTELVDQLVAQAAVVVRERQRGNELMLAVSAVPSDIAVADLQGAVQSLEAGLQDGRRQLLWLAAGLAALLALSVIALIAALRSRYVKLDEDNHMLQQANEDVQEQLLQSAKLSAIGQMVAGITHEINTPLAYVRTVFELIKERALSEDQSGAVLGRDTEDEEEAQFYREELQMLLDDGLHGIDEIATLIRTMKNFSRFDRGHAERFSVEDGLESALLIARSQLKYVADVDRDFDGVPEIMAAPSQIRQVFLNLINNAVQAMADSGTRGKLTLRTRLTSSDTIRVEIRDNGPGIPDDVLPRIFDPFFTTKPVGDGTGMGLSICYRIIENHGGTITVNTTPGSGTVFTVTLPRNAAVRDDEEMPGLPVRQLASA